MRILLVSLVVLALGLGGAYLATSPGAGAQTLLDGTFNGSVGSSGANPDAYVITLNTPATVAPGTYQLNITDYSSIHNFDLCAGTSCTGSNSLDKTDVVGTGPVSWIVNLTNGTYTYQCDVHFHQLQEQFVVGTATLALNASITKVTPARKVVTVVAKANQNANFKAWLLKSGKQVATASTTGTTVQLRLTPLKALKPGPYVAQVRVFTSPTTFKVIKKKITVK